MALSLCRFMDGIRVALVDRRDFAVPRDQRASALSAGVRRVFEALGVWDAMAAEAQPILEMKITDSGAGDLARPLFLSFAGEVAPGEPFAHMVPNRVLLAALLGQHRTARSISSRPPRSRGFAAEPRQRPAEPDGGRVLTAPLLVAADGGQSAAARPRRHRRRVARLSAGRHRHHHRPCAAAPAASPTSISARPDRSPACRSPGNRSSLVWTETRRRSAALQGDAARGGRRHHRGRDGLEPGRPHASRSRCRSFRSDCSWRAPLLRRGWR